MWYVGRVAWCRSLSQSMQVIRYVHRCGRCGKLWVPCLAPFILPALPSLLQPRPRSPLHHSNTSLPSPAHPVSPPCSYWDWMAFREEYGANHLNTACGIVKKAGLGCFHHFPEFFSVLDAIYGATMFKRLASNENVDFGGCLRRSGFDVIGLALVGLGSVSSGVLMRGRK